MARETYAYELHMAGVHIMCGADCSRAGTIERYHSHDYDGPLVCGCHEYSQ
jgi:hypothetical protein